MNYNFVMNKYQKIKKRTFEIIEYSEKGDLASKIFDFFIVSLIILNIAIIIIDTFTIPKELSIVLKYIELVSVIIFTIEYALRVWTADLLRPNLRPFKARLRYVFSFMAMIDLLAILPFYIPYIIPLDLRVLRALRIIRLLRLFKLNRYTTALKTVGSVFKAKSSELLSSLLVVLILMIISAVLMYNIESRAQPEAFDNAFSSFWWAVATLTTVGYGDIYPVTIVGKILSAIIALLGIALVAVPTGIIASGFTDQLQKERESNKDDEQKHFCPYCGKKID